MLKKRLRLLRSTPFRLALAFGLLFILAFLVADIITYQLLKRDLAQALDDSVRDTYSIVAATYSSEEEEEDFVAAVATYARLNNPEDSIFLLVNEKGERLAGNVSVFMAKDGLSTIEAGDIGVKGDDRIRIQAGTVGGNRLIVGESYSDTNDLERIALMSFVWASGVIVILACGGGAFFAARAQRRLDGIERAMSDVSAGNLARRIPLEGNGDDIDVVAGQMNEALDRLSALVEGMRQVSADIAHDLKTPLNRLRMTIEQAMQQSGRGVDVQPFLLDAREESDRISATFEALLRISQIEAGARKARFLPVDLADIMSSVAEIYGGVAEDNGQSLAFATRPASPCMVNGDRELLTQLFVNLVENAITHCPPMTSITLALEAGDGSFTATVADDGPGIPEAERELVFRRLYRLDKSRTTPGSGLGLSLVKAIADLHGAQITLGDRHPGLGVIMRFPAQQQGQGT
ncbi:signal transduction histidine kinase [Rhizobium sp. BK529]|uniref:HAMP domain-containing sensor histidine kinase n=1 Tax=Rhizobium sp. BK529 TaxID=2586983 RepID=UPI00161E2ACB|nr:HAMP domain-containing sensor histidine kinase [Rhizobium sp. BK529]MBB3590703.1 signal transduction histidine kinase [Rhizobium sp. BK529]